MNTNKLVLMMIAVIAIGIVALPSTVSMFGGQHTWYDIEGGGATDKYLPCVKCHSDIGDELLMSDAHATLGTASGDPNEPCYACHRVNESITYAEGAYSGGSPAAIPGQEAHAASTVACMECHEFDSDVVGYVGPAAGGFAQPVNSGFNYTKGASTGVNAAHNAYIQGAVNNSLMQDANEACIACHTTVAIDINWTHAYKMYLEASNADCSWNVTGFGKEGTYNVTTYGNMSGGTYSSTVGEVKWGDGTIVPNP